MKIIGDPNWLLFVEPENIGSDQPIIDDITKKMTHALHQSTIPINYYWWRGSHKCICGAISLHHDFRIPNGQWVNYLCVHYLAYHREDVPSEQLSVIKTFEGQEDPVELELCGFRSGRPKDEWERYFKNPFPKINILKKQY